MIRRIVPIARKETIHIRRDPRSLFLAIGLPIILIVLFGYAITLDIKHVAIGVVDQDRTTLSAASSRPGSGRAPISIFGPSSTLPPAWNGSSTRAGSRPSSSSRPASPGT